MVKNLPAMQETQVQFLGGEDPLEEEMATHSNIAWRIPQTEEPGRLQSVGSQKESDTTERLTHELMILLEYGDKFASWLSQNDPQTALSSLGKKKILWFDFAFQLSYLH